MCGIAGIYNLSGAPVDGELLRDMTDVQRHRGPDDQGLHLFSLKHANSSALLLDAVHAPAAGFEGGLGFDRLSILDLSAAGHQPMLSLDRMALIAYNGEVYNAFDYRAELEAAGYRFRSRTDTEVILYLYQHYGLDGMLERLNGMFAFCLVDLRQRCLYLVRDRLGIKPLYWWTNGKVLLFASELKAFLLHPAFVPELDEQRMDEQLMFRFVAGGGSLMKGVREIDPGGWLCVKEEQITEGRFWSPPVTLATDALDLAEAVDELACHVERSVKMRLLSDVTVGCQLSGGVDSSIVTKVAAEHSHMEGFSMVFDDRRFSEEPWIDEAAHVARVKCHKYTLTADSFCDQLETATWHLDQPLNHPNSVGIFLLAQQACRQITVFLSGEGADELFGGYSRFLHAKLRPKLRPWMFLLRRLPTIGSNLNRRFGSGPADPNDWFIFQTAFLESEKLRLLRPNAQIDQALASRRKIFESFRGGYLSRCLNYELRTYLVDLLIRQDKMTMAHSMENRVPFLDHRLVEFVRSLPDSHLVSDRLATVRPRMGTKLILKNYATRYFRPGFVYRPKVGFPLPLRSFFSHPSFRELMQDRLLPGMQHRGVVDAKIVGGWWEGVIKGQSANVEELWICAAFELWAQLFLDGQGRDQRGSKGLSTVRSA